MEAGAEAGEILVSDETVSSLPDSLFGEEKEGGRLLKSPPGAGGALEPLPPLDGLDLSLCVPAPIRRQLADGKAEPEHRQASVAFVHFGGADDLLAERGPEELADALENLVVTAQRVADEHGVTFLESDIDRDGGKLILVAGAPQTAGEDEERILRTARGIADAYTGLPLRMGLSRGRVFAGEVGAEFRKTYTILGTTAALAARLMGKAEPGQVLTTRDLLDRSRSAFETTELEPFALKGIAEPVTAFDVHVISDEVATPERRFPFVGRERELAILSAALGPVRMGFGNIVELIGEPGMGKSRLVEELQAHAPDVLTVTTSLHLCAASPNAILLELDRTYNPLQAELVKNPLNVHDGVVELPTGPGLGLEIDWDFVDDNPYRGELGIGAGARPAFGLATEERDLEVVALRGGERGDAERGQGEQEQSGAGHRAIGCRTHALGYRDDP